MSTSNRSPSRFDGRDAVVTIGGLYVTVAVGWPLLLAPPTMSGLSIGIVSAFIGVPGLIILVAGYRLPQTDIHPDYYWTISWWCLGGIGTMVAILLLYHIQPDTGLTSPERSVPILTAFGCVAGFGVGVYDAQAKTNAHKLELQNQKLERTQQQLKRSNERLEQFAHAASHDLQEPLRMVTSYLSLLERRYADELDEDGEEFIEFAVDGADRMRAMIEGLLDFSRVESHGTPFEPVDLNEVLADVRKNLERQIVETDARIDVRSLPRVEGDKSQLAQLFQNLLANAIEYSEEPPRIDVAAERNGERWLITVRDNGIGLDPAQSERIFEVFQRLHSREEYSGAGIGLALCKRIVNRHGGEIWVDSEPGIGSTFSVTLTPVNE